MRIHKEKPKTALGIAILVFIAWCIAFFLISFFTDSGDTVQHIFALGIETIGIVTACFLIILFAWTLNWWAILKEAGVKNAGLVLISQLTLVGWFADNLMPPGFIGGEAVSAYMLKKRRDVDFSIGMATRLFQVACWVVGLALFAVTSIFFIIIGHETMTTTYYFFIAIMVMYAVFFWLVIKTLYDRKFTKKFLKRIYSKTHWLVKKVTKKDEKESLNHALKWLESYHNSVRKIKRSKFMLVTGALTFLIIEVVEAFSIYVVVTSFGASISLPTIAAILSLSILFSIVTLIPGGLVSMELSISGLLYQAGAPVGAAIATTVIHRFFYFWLTNFIGGTLSMVLGLKTLTPYVDTKK
jgi:uncharacterized protein (TIRG00374 family)